jgi:hypothetical protein
MDGEIQPASAQAVPAAESTAGNAVVTPADSAVASNDVAAFREARRLERGDPERHATLQRQQGLKAARSGADESDSGAADSVKPAAAAATPAASPDRTVSKRQQTINDYERRLAQLTAENARLKGQPPADARPGGAPEASAPRPGGIAVDVSQPALEEAAFYTKHPEASTADYVRYLNRFDREVERVSREMEASQTAAQRAAHKRATRFHEQIKAAGDPGEVLQRIDPELAALETREAAVRRGQRPTAANDLADEIIDSDVALQVLEHLTAHPDDKAKLLALPNRRALVREFTRLEARFTPPATNGAAAPKTITDAPTPAVTLGARAASPADPIDSAVARGDVGAYRAARLRQRAAELR